MALLKRKKRKPQRAPGRYFMCGCGVSIPVSGSPGSIPEFTCPSCGEGHRLTEDRAADEQRMLQQGEKQRYEGEERLLRKRAEIEQRKKGGRPTIWCEPLKTTPQQLAENVRARIKGEREINALLSKDSSPLPSGRKPDPAYDKAVFRSKFAELRGERIPLSVQVKEVLKDDKSTDESKRDKLKKALRRRR